MSCFLPLPLLLSNNGGLGPKAASVCLSVTPRGIAGFGRRACVPAPCALRTSEPHVSLLVTAAKRTRMDVASPPNAVSGPRCVYCMNQTSHSISRLLTSKPLAAAGGRFHGTRGQPWGTPHPRTNCICLSSPGESNRLRDPRWFLFVFGFEGGVPAYVTASQDAGHQGTEDLSCLEATRAHVGARRACSARDTSPPCTPSLSARP